MERIKRDGNESMNNGGVVLNADRISELPEALILQILSLLPTKEAIATSVLSKQWESLWKMLPKLKFVYCRHIGNVFHALLSHKAPVLQSFHLQIRSDRSCNATDTTMLIIIALARNLRELTLQVDSGPWLRFPKSFYNCETLETLKLRFIGFMEIPCSSVGLKSLTTLDLYRIDFKDEESIVNLLSGCPNLKNLVVHRNPLSSVKTFTIAVPSLERLTICDYSRDVRAGYVINAPRLKYLKLDVTNGYIGFCRVENMTKLVEAHLIGLCLDEHVTTMEEPNVIYEKTNHKLVASLTSVKRLSLKVSPFTTHNFSTGSIFYQLAYLELNTHESAWWNLLSFMLQRSPKLQILKLIDLRWGKERPGNFGKWNQPTNVPECLSFHLETFIWRGYKEKQEDEIEVAKYILSNANRLKSATFFSIHIDLKERVEVVEDLNSVVRASNSCQILFESIY